jgi:predicted flavoprotein YhiN
MGKQLVVIGGGAAGFFCAVNAARMNPGLKVTLNRKIKQTFIKSKSKRRWQMQYNTCMFRDS